MRTGPRTRARSAPRPPGRRRSRPSAVGPRCAWIRPSRNDCSSRADGVVGVLLEVAQLLGGPDPRDHLGPLHLGQRSRARPAAARRPRRSARPRPAARPLASGWPRPRSPAEVVDGRGGLRGRPSALRGAGSPSAPSASPSGSDDDAGRRPRRLHRLGQQRAGQAGRLALAGRPTQVRERQDDVPVGEGRPLGVGDPVGERGEQRVLVFLDGRRRRPPDPRAGRHRRAWSQWPPEYGRRSPSAVAPIAATRRLIECSRRADVEDRLRREPERRPSRAATAFEVGRSPSRRSPGTRSIHFPIRVKLDRRRTAAAPPAR